MIEQLSGPELQLPVKQDPFHVIQWFTSKVKCEKTKSLASDLSDAIYRLDHELHELTIVAERVEAVLRSVPEALVSASILKWDGSMASNLEQNRSRDMSAQSNSYIEGGHTVKVVSTSQVEGFKSQRSTIQDACVRRLEFFRSMHLIPFEVERARDFTPTEYELLRQIRNVQFTVDETATSATAA